MRKLLIILLAFMLVTPVTPAFGQIRRERVENRSTTPPATNQQPKNNTTTTTRPNRTNRSSQSGRNASRTRTQHSRYRSPSHTTSRSTVRDDAPLIEVSFGCNVSGALIMIDDDVVEIDDSCMLREGEHEAYIQAEGYQDYTETIEVDEDNNYFYFELTEIPYGSEVAGTGLGSGFGSFEDDEPETAESSMTMTATPTNLEPVAEPVVEPIDQPDEWISVKGVTFTMAYVHGGTFTRFKLPDQADLRPASVPPAHHVTLSSYYIGKHEVTRELWYAVMADSVVRVHPKEPMSNVSLEDCQAFIVKLNALTGKNFRLPTDSEWEFAARGGVKSQGFAFAGSNNIDEVAWYEGNSEMEYHDVGLKKPNELGLYDMTGSLWEWVTDWTWNWYDDIDERSPALVNPKGPATGKNRVARGGGLNTEIENCCICRPDPTPEDCRNDELGFRLVLQ